MTHQSTNLGPDNCRLTVGACTVAGAHFVFAYLVYLTGGIRSPFLPWAALAWIASLPYLRYGRARRARLAIACGAALLGLAAAYALRPSPSEIAPATLAAILLACPLAPFACLLAGLFVRRWSKGGWSKDRAAEAARLAQLADEAESADRQTTRFFAEANHAIRTPLNAMIGYSEMILEDGSGAFNTEQLGDMLRIQQATDQLLKLVSDVFDLSQIERHRGNPGFSGVPGRDDRQKA